MSTIDEKCKEYLEYIKVHKLNVVNAFLEYGELLIEVAYPLYTVEDRADKFKELVNRMHEHDDSKYDTEEFDIYRQRFHTADGEPEISDLEFNKAWNHHIHNNPHHPEYWTMYDWDTNNVLKFDMPVDYIIEMVCDWIAMGETHDSKAYVYYRENKESKQKKMSPNTIAILERILDAVELYDKSKNIN